MMAVKLFSKHEHYASFPDFEAVARLKPLLVCTVKFMKYTPGGGLRQPVFKGLRSDKAPMECVVSQRSITK